MRGSSAERNEESQLRLSAGAVCSAFDSSETVALVFDEQLRLLQASANAPLAPHQQVGFGAMGRLNQHRDSALAAVVRRVLSSQRAEVLELTSFPFAGGPASWRAQCVPLQRSFALVLLSEQIRPVTTTPSRELQALRAQLERSNRFESLGKLTGSIAHDFNNLLTGIRGSVALARQNTSHESHDAALNAADLAAQRASEMTRQLLTFARGPEVETHHTPIEAVVQETVALIRCLPNAPQVRLELEPGLGEVEMATAALHQVLLNLLINAQEALRDSTRRGSITVAAHRVWPRESLPAGLEARDGATGPARVWLRLVVSDTGPGMGEETRARIFEPFFSTKRERRGSGLGLVSVRRLVEQAGGWVEVESELGHGSSFGIYLPTVSEGVEMGVDGSSASGRKNHTDSVLICDDESRLAMLTAGLLEEYGYRPTTVEVGEAALEVMRDASRGVDVLLLDVNLAAGVSAREVLDTMQQEGLHLPVILTSGFAPEDVPQSLREHARVASYLAKPYTVDELVRAIGGAVAGPQVGTA